MLDLLLVCGLDSLFFPFLTIFKHLLIIFTYQDTLTKLTECQNKPPVVVEKTVEVPSTATYQAPATEAPTSTGTTQTIETTPSQEPPSNQSNIDANTNHTNDLLTRIINFFNSIFH